jgi:ABC-2 type transport system ATP-binding protein
MKIIETIHLTKNFGENLALKNINLTIQEGEIFGLIGLKGSGKSTFIQILLNFVFPSIGHGKIFNLDCVKESVEIKKKVGYVPDEVKYYPKLTVEELFKMTLAFHKKNNDEGIISICDALNLEKHVQFQDLSIGDKKKVGIGSALVIEPELLILDEPMNTLDSISQKQLVELLKEYNKKGTTILITSCNLNDIQYCCTRVGFLKEGRLIKTEDLTRLRQVTKIIEIKGEDFDINCLKNLDPCIMKKTEKKIRFSYKGEIKKLLKILNELEPEDLIVKNASLEDEFLIYYQGGDNDDTFKN